MGDTNGHKLSFVSDTIKDWKFLWNLEERLAKKTKKLISENLSLNNNLPDQCYIFEC